MSETEEKDGPSKGGVARAKALSREERSAIAQKAARTRWDADLPRATHKGDLHIGEVEIPCFVLEGGRRVLYQRALVAALGMSRGSSGQSGGDRLAKFTGGKALEPFVSEDLLEVTTAPIRFRTPSGALAYGYEATVLADICDVVLAARGAGRLQKQQMHIADQCEMLVRGFARVGIIALVDEATGYQEERKRDELQKLLAAYISPELLPWAEMFPAEFYSEIFRLRGWKWESKGGRRPRLVGKLTNFIVYDRLPVPVVEELRAINPVRKDGRRKDKIFQWMTEEIGHPVLKGHLIGSIALMRATPDGQWARFARMLDRAYPKPGEIRQEVLFDEVDDG